MTPFCFGRCWKLRVFASFRTKRPRACMKRINSCTDRLNGRTPGSKAFLPALHHCCDHHFCRKYIDVCTAQDTQDTRLWAPHRHTDRPKCRNRARCLRPARCAAVLVTRPKQSRCSHIASRPVVCVCFGVLGFQSILSDQLIFVVLVCVVVGIVLCLVSFCATFHSLLYHVCVCGSDSSLVQETLKVVCLKFMELSNGVYR